MVTISLSFSLYIHAYDTSLSFSILLILSSNKLKHYWAVHPVAHGGKLGAVIGMHQLPVIVIVGRATTVVEVTIGMVVIIIMVEMEEMVDEV